MHLGVSLYNARRTPASYRTATSTGYTLFCCLAAPERNTELVFREPLPRITTSSLPLVIAIKNGVQEIFLPIKTKTLFI
jgi:hypothetical protein